MITEEQEKEQASMAEQWSKLTDLEAKNQVKLLKKAIEKLKKEDLSRAPQKIMELQKLTTTLFWCQQNKLRSVNFRITSLGQSMRKYTRHPNAGSIKSPRKAGQERETVQDDTIPVEEQDSVL